MRYSSTGTGDSPDVTLTRSNAVVERTVGLPGGALLTTRAGGDVWSYPNIHGHIAATANVAGAKTGITVIYSPDGVALDPLSFSGSDPVVVDPPDNSAGSFDYGWQGKDQRPLEHVGTLLATIEMGARQYVRSIGRFIEMDPVEGASASDYDYCLGDPINCEDLDGNIGMPKWAKSVGRGVAAVGREAWKCRDQIAFGLAVVGTFTCAGSQERSTLEWRFQRRAPVCLA